MKKRLSILMMTLLLGTASLWARPGYSKPVDVLQPDGTTVTLLMHGDEFLSYMTTTDGYTLVKGDNGFYCYAEKQDGALKATAIVAKNATARSAEEQAFLVGKQKGIRADMTEATKQFKAQAAQLYANNHEQEADGKRRVTTIWPRINYNNFKGLVILVNWNDRQFNMDNPQEFYQKLTSEKNYQDDTHTNYPVSITGSARDYFYDNSMGIFDPTFDVVGPVTINYSCEYPKPKDSNGNVSSNYFSRMCSIIKATLDGVNATVNFADYDMNNDGYIDIVYFVFAGYGSYVQGNNSNYIWPHANDFTGLSSWQTGIPSYDGKKFGRYACSVEIQDWESQAAQHVWYDGIGTICHEFSHVLGLADHYDTDYEQNGQASTAGAYDIMDGGADHNYGLTPVGYNVFERYQLGFVEPQELTAGEYQMENFNTSNQGYMVKSSKNNQEFYLENRQKQGWDAFLPNHGLLVWRADTSKPSVWQQNNVNIKPDAMCFELLGNAPIKDLDLTAETNSTWGSKGAAIDLYDITETDGVITFKAGKDLYPTAVEDFENTPLSESGATNIAGKFCKWTLDNAAIVDNTDGYGNGQHVLKMMRSGKLISSALEQGVRTMKFTVKNKSNYQLRFKVKVSTNGTNWTELGSTTTIAKNKDVELSFNSIAEGSYLQFEMLASNNAAVCYIDDINVSLTKAPSTDIKQIANSQKLTANGQTYNLAGQRVDANFKGIVIKNGRKIINK